MSLSFNELRTLKAQGLSYSAVLVKSYLDEHGFVPVGFIADACGLSVRSVDRAIADLKRLGLLSSVSKTKMAHDHANHGSCNKGTKPVLADKAGEEVAKTDDPIRDQLSAYEVLPWCVDILLERCDRQVLERQLAHHAFRLEKGFKFKSHAAAYLFRACLHDYAPPEGYHSSAHKTREGLSLESEPQPRPPVFEPAPEAPVSQEEVVREMLSSPLPSVRRMGIRLAKDWGVRLPEIASAVG